MIKQISLAHVAKLMHEGYVRYKRDDDGNGVGNIEEELGLSPSALKEIFANEKLKGIRIKVPTYKLIDDYNPENDTVSLIDDIEDENPINTSSESQLNDVPEVLPEDVLEQLGNEAEQVSNEIEKVEEELFA